MNCEICKNDVKHLEKHHIIPKSRGGSDDKSNLIMVCSECHGLAHDVSFSNERGGGLIKEKIKMYVERKKSSVNEEVQDSLTTLKNLFGGKK